MTQTTHRRPPARKRRRRQRRPGLWRLTLLLAVLLAGFGILRSMDGGLLRWTTRLEENPLSPTDFRTINGYVTCTAVPTRRGVDVSQYQEEVDWQEVYAAGFDFAFVRIGYRGNTSGELYADELARQHLAGAKEAGLDVGVYFYSQAVSPEEAAEEARWCLSFLENTTLELPVVYDWEWVDSDARTANMDRETLTECARTFCQAIEDAGYRSMLYFNSHISRDLLDLQALQEYPFWFAQYRDAMDFGYKVDLWQYTETGTVPGIKGKVDIDLMFLYG
ncbi:MAG: glycoside hydrolase family 25 protein [Oscillospiraceae bacterium]|nr:glycoside hydrolase family 25 protein [Oscillospiraceae bacterium]